MWDGPSGETCTGPKRNYLRWNNPHKLSLYLAAGIPVLIWSEAALADWVEKEQVGICLNQIKDIKTIFNQISTEEYNVYSNNALLYVKRLRSALHTQIALCKTEKTLHKRQGYIL